MTLQKQAIVQKLKNHYQDMYKAVTGKVADRSSPLYGQSIRKLSKDSPNFDKAFNEYLGGSSGKDYYGQNLDAYMDATRTLMSVDKSIEQLKDILSVQPSRKAAQELERITKLRKDVVDSRKSLWDNHNQTSEGLVSRLKKIHSLHSASRLLGSGAIHTGVGLTAYQVVQDTLNKEAIFKKLKDHVVDVIHASKGRVSDRSLKQYGKKVSTLQALPEDIKGIYNSLSPAGDLRDAFKDNSDLLKKYEAHLADEESASKTIEHLREFLNDPDFYSSDKAKKLRIRVNKQRDKIDPAKLQRLRESTSNLKSRHDSRVNKSLSELKKRESSKNFNKVMYGGYLPAMAVAVGGSSALAAYIDSKKDKK